MISSTFSIKDLENLSGIKAHTIRMWEKRYELLQPERSATNIRYYDLHALQKLLNVSFLKNTGYKISAIARMSNLDIEQKVKIAAQQKQMHNLDLQKIKVAMVNFDEQMFNQVYTSIVNFKGFEATFYEVLIPFLEELGNLWQSNTINVAHEHFISNLIKQKVLIESEKISLQARTEQDLVYILFLPENEMHDLGLLFLNYQMINAGYKTIYLGASMSVDSLTFFQRNNQKPVFITFLTVFPTVKKFPAFINKFNKKLNSAPLLLLGRRIDDLDKTLLGTNQMAFTGIDRVLHHLNEQKEL